MASINITVEGEQDVRVVALVATLSMVRVLMENNEDELAAILDNAARALARAMKGPEPTIQSIEVGRRDRGLTH